MDYLTTKQVAELKGCSVQHIKKMCKDKILQAIESVHPQNKKMCYMIPISALSENLQAKYYSQKHTEIGILPEKIEPENSSETALKYRLKGIKKAFEEFSETERLEIKLWIEKLNEWQAERSKHKNKAEFDKLFVVHQKYIHPDIEISTDILYRKYAAYKNGCYGDLIDNRGGWNKGICSMEEDIWKIFTKLYLVSSQPTVSRCYKDLKAWIKTYYPEWYSIIPSERTFRRRIQNEIPDCVLAYTRLGEKACFDKYCEYIERDYADLQANEIWIADNHTLDITTMSPEGKLHRMSLTAYMDTKSGVIVGWNLCDHPCSQSTLLALRAAALNGYGIPWDAYFDNVSEFLTHDIAGRGHRRKADWNKEEMPPTILSLLNITMVNVLVKNAKAKNIERYFYTFKEFISKTFHSYCGGTILERPEGRAEIISVTISEEAEQQLRELEEYKAMNDRLARAKGV